MTDDPGVLGNLPRSRPGRRSEKRGGTWSEAAGAAAAAGSASEAPKRQARARKSGTATRSTASHSAASRKPRASAGTRPAQPRPAPPPSSSSDPLSDTIRAAGGLAEASVKTAVKVAGGVLKRLPRP